MISIGQFRYTRYKIVQMMILHVPFWLVTLLKYWFEGLNPLAPFQTKEKKIHFCLFHCLELIKIKFVNPVVIKEAQRFLEILF